MVVDEGEAVAPVRVHSFQTLVLDVPGEEGRTDICGGVHAHQKEKFGGGHFIDR